MMDELQRLGEELPQLKETEEAAAQGVMRARQKCEQLLADGVDWRPQRALLDAADDLKAAENTHLAASRALEANHGRRAQLLRMSREVISR